MVRSMILMIGAVAAAVAMAAEPRKGTATIRQEIQAATTPHCSRMETHVMGEFVFSQLPDPGDHEPEPKVDQSMIDAVTRETSILIPDKAVVVRTDFANLGATKAYVVTFRLSLDWQTALAEMKQLVGSAGIRFTREEQRAVAFARKDSRGVISVAELDPHLTEVVIFAAIGGFNRD